MRVRSTGLGRTDLVLEQDGLAVKDGYLLLSLRSTEPVHWHIRILLEPRDIGRFFLSLLRGSFLLWLFSIFRKPGTPPSDY